MIGAFWRETKRIIRDGLNQEWEPTTFNYDTLFNRLFVFLSQIIALNRENLSALRQEFPQEMSDLILASDIYEILPSVSKVSLIT